jgi:quercetin dioxygenase-like cupin family protein
MATDQYMYDTGAHVHVPDASSSPFVAWGPLMDAATAGQGAAVALEECWVQLIEGVPGHVIEPEAHAYSEQVLQVLAGNLRLALDGTPYDLDPDSLMVIPTGVHHDGRTDTGSLMFIVTAPVGFGPDNMRLDLADERGPAIQPAGTPVVRWQDVGAEEQRGTYIGVRCVTGSLEGTGGPVALQMVRGRARIRVGEDVATLDSESVAIVLPGTSFAAEVEPGGRLLAIDTARAHGMRPRAGTAPSTPEEIELDGNTG